jgi:hypothetical protein
VEGFVGPVEKKCKNCSFWVLDRGIFTVTGWTGSGCNRGHCHLMPTVIGKSGDDFCSSFKISPDALNDRLNEIQSKTG